MASDFRLRGGTSTAIASEIKAFNLAGLSVGLLQIDAPFDVQAPMHPAIQRSVEIGHADLLDSDAATQCDLLVLHNPIVFRNRAPEIRRIRPTHRLMVAHHVPLSPGRYLNYDPWQIDKYVRATFGGAPIWAPVSPVCRKQFLKAGFDHSLLARDWHSIVDVEEWGWPRANPQSSSVVIGRHSRPEWEKWPATREDLLASLPALPGFDVRILGGGGYLRTLAQSIPDNWQVFAFNAMPPREFLRTIDFFSYFHHPQNLESFGRAPAEAAASGCILILPEYLRDTFGESAIYCEPHGVADAARAIHGDVDLFRRQSQVGYDYIRTVYGPDSLVALAKATIAQPQLAPQMFNDIGAKLRNEAVAAALRARYWAGRRKRSARTFARRILNLSERALPRNVRTRRLQLRADRNTARSPDRKLLVDNIFPALARTSAFAPGANVLWVGCRTYTTGYYAKIEALGARCWTMDIDADASRWGNSGRHLVGNLLNLPSHYPAGFFAAILCNGILGWGVDTAVDQRKAIEAMAATTKTGGWMVLGWNTNRMDDPVAQRLPLPWYTQEPLPGFGERCVVEGCTHVYDIFRRAPDTPGVS